MSNVTGILISTTTGKAEKVTLNGTLQGYYDALDCDIIDIAYRKIGDKYFSIYCDDEGLYKEEVTTSCIEKSTGEPMLVGNIFICSDDGMGETISLTDDEADMVMGHIIKTVVFDGWEATARRQSVLKA